MFKFKVTPDNAEVYEVTAGSRDVITWEKLHKTNSLMKLQDELRMTDLTTVAYLASVRQGLFEGTLAEFEKNTDLETLEDEEAEPFPQAA